jgi:hypothetical protein
MMSEFALFARYGSPPILSLSKERGTGRGESGQGLHSTLPFRAQMCDVRALETDFSLSSPAGRHPGPG